MGWEGVIPELDFTTIRGTDGSVCRGKCSGLTGFRDQPCEGGAWVHPEADPSMMPEDGRMVFTVFYLLMEMGPFI